MLKKVKFGLYYPLLTGLLNIVLITYFEAVGAATSTVAVFVFTSAIGIWYFSKKIPNKI